MDRAVLGGDHALTTATLPVPCRGSRSYVHSADIFEALTTLAHDRYSPEAFVRSLVLRRHASRELQAVFGPAAEPIGTFAIWFGADERRGVLVETETPIVRRVPYDEARAVAAADVGKDYAAFAGPVPDYTTFELLLVAMKLAGGDAARDAWLCQVSLVRPLLDPAPVAVRVTQRLLLFHRFEIMQGGVVVGSATATWRA